MMTDTAVEYNNTCDCISANSSVYCGSEMQQAVELNPLSNFRPRGSLARALIHKQQHDKFLSNFDRSQDQKDVLRHFVEHYELSPELWNLESNIFKENDKKLLFTTVSVSKLQKKIEEDRQFEKWYQCDLHKVPPELAAQFVELSPDEETVRFLKQSEEKSDWILTQLWHSLMKSILGWFMTQTSINGWLQRGSMFVISLPQLLKLLKVDGDYHRDTLLDLGAGDGEVTARIAPLFSKVYVTEVSNTMKTLLQRRGYELLDIENWTEKRKYDVISCLNLIDRCDTPMELLKQIRSALAPDGRVLLAVVLPFSPYVESGSNDYKPKELLPINGSCFEEQVKSVVHDILTPAKFEVVSWSRVPYLCEGDLEQSYYWLDDVIFVLKIAN